jgi:RimJ/RimL family protein N-acetyltransferase
MDNIRHWSEELQTERLELFALTSAALYAYLHSIDVLEADMGRRLSRGILTPIVHRAIQMKLKKMKDAPPQEWAWYTYWLVVIRETQFGAGLMGFKGPPDDQGRVEIGYGIDPETRGVGYTTEAAAVLIEWAFQHPECQEILAPETRKDNPASHRVLAKLGMQAYTETHDTISYRLFRGSSDSD